MTAQTPDQLQYEGEDFTILGDPARIGFDPRDYGLVPVPRDMGNHRGYWCRYAVSGGRLILDALHVNCARDRLPSVNGIEAEAPRLELAEVTYITPDGFEEKMEERLTNAGYHVYRGVGLALEFTGSVKVGRGMSAWPPNAGYPPAWVYRTVLELSFETGRLTGAEDVSASAADERESEGWSR